MRGSRGMSSTVSIAVVCAWTVWLAGCSRQQDQNSPQDNPTAPADAAPTAPTPQAALTAPAANLPAESSLAIKRGIAMLAQDRTTFQPCGEKVELWLLDQTDGVLTQAFAMEMQNGGPLKLYVEAYGERAPVSEDIAAARAYGGTFVLEEVLYAGLQSEGKGCEAPTAKYIVMARGNEPFWSVEVNETQMVWRQPDAADITLDSPQTQDAEGAVHYRAAGSGHQVELMIDAQQCRDSMSGDFFAYSAKAILDGKQFSGCARVGE